MGALKLENYSQLLEATEKNPSCKLRCTSGLKLTSKDPTLFSSGDPNLYGYAMNDPVNFIDPDGKNPWVLVPIVVGGGIGIVLGPDIFNHPRVQQWLNQNQLDLNLRWESLKERLKHPFTFPDKESTPIPPDNREQICKG